ncbi:hypothetical protein E4U55_000916 [Claviceps digitariae]|nr:hypothetical protein E4U55_000916 [Claviceps digitariae]
MSGINILGRELIEATHCSAQSRPIFRDSRGRISFKFPGSGTSGIAGQFTCLKYLHTWALNRLISPEIGEHPLLVTKYDSRGPDSRVFHHADLANTASMRAANPQSFVHLGSVPCFSLLSLSNVK